MEKKAKILVIDDEQGLRDMLSFELGQQGYEVVTASNGKEGIKKAKEEKFDLVISDIKMPGMDGITVLEEIKKIDPQMEVIMATGYGTMETAIESLRKGAYDYINKPYNIDELLVILKKAIEKQQLVFENKKLLVDLVKAKETLEQKVEERTKELKKIQAKLVQQSRIASVGELAAGLAHEIGNPLQTILGNADLLLMENKSEELQSIKVASLSAKKIIEGLLDFSRQRKMNFIFEDINFLVEKTLSLYGKQLELKETKVVKNYGDLPKIMVSPSKIEQVFLNLITNAQKAMPNGGTLTITTRTCHVERSETSQDFAPSAQNDFIEISFKDTGCGIAKENLSRVFEPFFTTYKERTGLGLSISYGIVKQHGGNILVNSDGSGKGTEFLIKLPLRGQFKNKS